ncbi:hypothetical protein E2C01_082846 [Portunus trituberculatus]|uniref:Uncharacterized protein n=1 Tax=Portunus trituberculatus TaxID=210409 RepID=A0A5B7IQZ2_PORTR|nr:hypothetical protein [Portunus trituberculatus]
MLLYLSSVGESRQ